MNSYQRENWKRIRGSKTTFFTKYISLFSIPIVVLVIMVFTSSGIIQLYNEVSQASVLDIGAMVFIILGWFYLGYIHGKSVWETWEKEYSGEKAFVTRIRDISKQATGATNSPYKEVFALISSLIFILLPLILSIYLLAKAFEIYIPDVRFDSSDYRTVLSFILVAFTILIIIVAIFIVGSFIGLLLWIVVLRPFYSYEEITNFTSLSYSNNSRLEKTFNKPLLKVANFIYQRN